MKRLFSLLTVILICISIAPTYVFAHSPANPVETIFLEDGMYITVEISETATRAASTKNGSKTYTGRASNGDELWRAVLSGTFTYNGTSATCITSSCTVSITDTDWYEISKTTGRSGNSAIAYLKMGRKFLGITVEEKSYDLILTCDPNGNLS